MRIGVCPGSFDPVTNGHVDIFERGSRLVDKLIIAVSSNPNKNSLFTMEERVEMIRNAVKHIPNVEVDCSSIMLNPKMQVLLFVDLELLVILNMNFNVLYLQNTWMMILKQCLL